MHMKCGLQIVFLWSLLSTIGITLLITIFTLALSGTMTETDISTSENYAFKLESHLSVNNSTNIWKQDLANTSSRDRKQRKGKLLKILLWSPVFQGMGILPSSSKSFRRLGCRKNCCEVTDDRTLIAYCDAVVFHIRTFAIFDIPQLRYPRQRWVFLSLEAPPYSSFPGLSFMHGMFNWTMTYRKDSDVIIPYGRIIQDIGLARVRNQTEKQRVWDSKTRMAIWMVSHCKTDSNREGFVRELQNHLEIDIIGHCGGAVCPYNRTNSCMASFEKKYLFFLAFENAICKDYVTEKFFRALRYDMVPVVLGGADYHSIAPSHSYIDASDYPSPYHLAIHLREIAKNSTLYFEYLRWKDIGYRIKDRPDDSDLCAKLYSKKSETKRSTYSSMIEWWTDKSHCSSWKSRS